MTDPPLQSDVEVNLAPCFFRASFLRSVSWNNAKGIFLPSAKHCQGLHSLFFLLGVVARVGMFIFS